MQVLIGQGEKTTDMFSTQNYDQSGDCRMFEQIHDTCITKSLVHSMGPITDSVSLLDMVGGGCNTLVQINS